MATIGITGQYMAQKFADVMGFLNTPEQTAQNKYLGEVFVIEYSTTQGSSIELGMPYGAKIIVSTVSRKLKMEDDPDNNEVSGVGWLKRIKNFGLERKVYVETDLINNSVSITNFIETRTKTVNEYSHIFNPIFIYQESDKKIDHIGFFKVINHPTYVSGVSYRPIMTLQITPTGTQDSTYGNLYHLKHLTFTFS